MSSILKGRGSVAGYGRLRPRWAEAADLEDDEVARCAHTIDGPAHERGRRTSDIVNMFQDTLVAMDWDGKTAIPYLAKFGGP